jgi:putative transposase
MEGQHSARLCGSTRPAVDLSLPASPPRTGRSGEADQGDCSDAGALRLPAHPCSLRREGWQVNAKRIYRLYREMGLQLRNKTPKRRVKAKLREDRTVAMRRNEIWAMDFVHDQLATGRKLRVLTVVDLFSRFSPVVDPAFSYKGSDVVHTLERICRDVGYPKVIRVDQGSEFISRDLDLWAYQNEVTLDFFPARQTHRQCVHRVLQRHLPRRMPECALVHEPCRRTAKNGRLAQRLQ